MSTSEIEKPKVEEVSEVNGSAEVEEIEEIEKVAIEKKPKKTTKKIKTVIVEEDEEDEKPEDKDSVGLVKCVLIALISSILSVVAYDQFFAQKIVAIDLKGMVEQQRELFMAGKLTENEIKQQYDQIQALVTSLPKRKAVIMGDAVVRNVEIIKP